MSHEHGHPPLLGGGEPQAPELGPRARLEDPEKTPGVWDKKGNQDLLLRTLYVVAALLVVVDFVIHRHTEHPWEHVKAFYPLYGFVGIVILVLAAKGLRRLVMRPEDYYGDE